MEQQSSVGSELTWKLERLLLEPSIESREKLKAELSCVQGIPATEKLISIIMCAVECDVYRGITLLDRSLGKGVLIDTGEISKATTCREIFDHLVKRCQLFLQSDTEGGLGPLYVLAGAVLLLNIFIRVNWTGPPVGVVSCSEKHLASQYRNKVVNAEGDDDVSLDSLDNLPNDGRAFAAFASEKIANNFNQRCLLKSPDITSFDVLEEKTHDAILMASVMEELQIDGEPIYTGINGALYFVAAMAFVYSLNGCTSSGQMICRKDNMQQLTTVGIWQGRIAFIWQRIVRNAMFSQCPTLYKCCILNLGEILKRSGVIPENFSLSLHDEALLKSVDLKETGCAESSNSSKSFTFASSKESGILQRSISDSTHHPVQCSEELGTLLVVELASRLPYYNMSKLYEPLLSIASSRLGFFFSFTGRLGIRRKYQKHVTPQLVLVTEDRKAESTNNDTCESECNTNPNEVYRGEAETSETNQNTAVSSASATSITEDIGLLDVNIDSDILERPKLSEDPHEMPLTPVEQCILLSKALHVLQTMPEDDELNLEYLNAIVVRCLDSKEAWRSWLLYSVALWVRCKTEYHRTKTVERATLQLHKLCDSYYETEVAAGNRLQFIWHMWSPSSWGIKREICKRMCSIGSFLTAYEIYQKLHLWEDAIQCLIIVGRKSDAKDLVLKQLERAPNPLLWCFLGDIEGDISHYNTAWQLSKGHCARAQRTLGSFHFNKGDLKAAVTSLELALAINPMRESSQFLLGCSYLKLNQLDRAITVFARVVALNPSSYDAWANMCSAHMNINNLKEARLCIEQAVKHNPSKWQFWEIHMYIGIRSRDIQAVCMSVDKLLNLGQKSIIKASIVAFLVDASTRFPKTHNTQRMIARTLDSITKHITDDHNVWGLCARYFSFQKCFEEALESTFRQYRAIEGEIVSSLSEAKADVEEQREHDVAQLKRLTDCLGSMVTLLKRLSTSSRKEKRETVVQTLKSIRERFKARMAKVTEQFLSEMDVMIENADVEDVVCVDAEN